MNPTALLAVTFATFMADFLILNGLVPPPRNEEEAKGLIALVLQKFDEFAHSMHAQGAFDPAPAPNAPANGDIN